MLRWNVMCLLIAIVVVAYCRAESSPSQRISVGRGGCAQSATLPETASCYACPQDTPYPLYPEVLDKRPTFPSPYLTEKGKEILTAILKNGKYVFMPVTVENGRPLVYSTRIEDLFGKDQGLCALVEPFPRDTYQSRIHCGDHLDRLDRRRWRLDRQLYGVSLVPDWDCQESLASLAAPVAELRTVIPFYTTRK